MSELNRTSRTSDRRGVSKNFSLFVNTMTGASRPSCFFCPPCASMLIDQREIDRKRERERERVSGTTRWTRCRLTPRSSSEPPPLKGELILVVILAGYWTGAGKGVTWSARTQLSDRCSWIEELQREMLASATEERMCIIHRVSYGDLKL